MVVLRNFIVFLAIINKVLANKCNPLDLKNKNLSILSKCGQEMCFSNLMKGSKLFAAFIYEFCKYWAFCRLQKAGKSREKNSQEQYSGINLPGSLDAN
jgi:hypothetical protein